MIYEEIRQYLGSQNFALTATNNNEICVLKNQVASRGLFCVLINASDSYIWGPSQINSINSQLVNAALGGDVYSSNDVLFIYITSDPYRDKYLASDPGVNLWIVDRTTGKLLIYVGQSDDFYGLRSGIEEAAERGLYAQSQTGANTSHASDRISENAAISAPYFTIALIAINVIYYLLLAINGDPTDPSYMIHAGANYATYVFENFEVWRLVTCMFMHFGMSHLIGNMVFLGIFGYQVEKRLGHLKFIAIYMLSGFGASVISACWYSFTGRNVVSGGASGAIYGLIGVIIYYFLLINWRKPFESNLKIRFGIALVFIFYSSFISSEVDGAAHVGGFICGMLLSMIFVRRKKNEKR